MSTATDYHTGLLPNFAPIGRRIEVLLHSGPASTVELIAKSRANFGRLMFTFDTIRFAKSWSMASHHWEGSSLFIYDGHSVSTRCPGCANIAHFIADDLLMSLLAMLETGATVNRTVANLLATEGRRPVKNFQLDLLASLFANVQLMGPDEVHCFENLRIATNAKKVTAETLRAQEYYKPWGVSQATLHRFRARVVPSRSSASQTSESFGRVLLDGRQSAKRRKWTNAVEVAAMLGATIVDLGPLTLQETSQMLRDVSVFVTPIGAQLWQLLWLPAEALAVVISCQSFDNELEYNILKELGLQIVDVAKEGCPKDPQTVAGWAMAKVDNHSHPVAVLGQHYSGVIPLHDRYTCAFRFLETSPSTGRFLVALPVLEVLEGVSLTAAMQRCIDWDYDCEAVRPVGSTFELYTQLWAVPRAAAWQQLSCCEADSSGKCSLPDGRFTAGRLGLIEVTILGKP